MDEVPVVCVMGREAEGRRRRLVLLTDRRILVLGRRAEAPVVVGADVVRADHDRMRGTLRLTSDGVEVGLRDVDPAAATLLVDHLRHRHTGRPGATGSLRLLTA
jgi:hypothetical protein